MVYEKVCKQCGKVFQSWHHNATYCSQECFYEHAKNIQRTKNREISIERRKEKEKEHKKLLGENKFKYLKDLAEKQQYYTTDVLEKNYCECCNTNTKKLIIHHISYNPEETITLCVQCHSILHNCILNGDKVRKYTKRVT